MEATSSGRKSSAIERSENQQCAKCGSTAKDRQYHRTPDRLTCEHCLLNARKQAAGLVDEHPYEEFAESLAAALDLREHETGLHAKRVASHTLILARHYYVDAATLWEIY